MNMTGTVIKGINFRKIESGSPAEEILRDISVDLAEAGDDGKTAEIFVVVRYADKSFDIWTSNTFDVLDRVGAIEALKNHLLNPQDGDTP